MGVTLTFVTTYHWVCMPRVAVVVIIIGGMIFIASHCLSTVLGIAAIIVAPPWMEFVVAFPGIAVNFSLLPESLDLSWSSGIGEGGRHGEVIGVLLGVVGIEGWTGELDGELVAFSGGLLYKGPTCVQCLHLGHSVFRIACHICSFIL